MKTRDNPYRNFNKIKESLKKRETEERLKNMAIRNRLHTKALAQATSQAGVSMKSFSHAMQNFGKSLGGIIHPERHRLFAPASEAIPEWRWLWNILLLFKTEERKKIESVYVDLSDYLEEHLKGFDIYDFAYLRSKELWWTRHSRGIFGTIEIVFRIPQEELPRYINSKDPIYKVLTEYRLIKGF